ncbi:P-loop containing nucleoside triphosphate hydrolase protein [Coniochaeta sp. 2T2.1]|nr:P-loop containing nucleoside triphosphate hydrolase protein [Coniochaeta sp. 2T2.1]
MAETDRHAAFFAAWRRSCTEHIDTTSWLIQQIVEEAFPDHHVTRVTQYCDLLGYASAGHAITTLEHSSGMDAVRMFSAPKTRLDREPGKLVDDINFGRWTYTWQEHDFIHYEIRYYNAQRKINMGYFLLAPRATNEARDGHHSVADPLVLAASQWARDLHDEIYVFDNQSWNKDAQLYLDVKSSSWDDVVLDPTMKRTLIRDVRGFFDNRELYHSLKVPWKRGVIFHGVPGNGKTISLKALINSLSKREDPIPSLYVKSFDGCRGAKWSIQSIFEHARNMAPCLLVFEDLDSLVEDECRSYFLNEVDGLESNDGILMIGSTNHLDRLDSAITKRPSRFDRKYHFKVPSLAERLEYCLHWRRKFTESKTVDFPDEICHPIAAMTEGFSFAYLKELFVTSLLALARGEPREAEDGPDRAEVGTTPSDRSSVSDSVIVEKPDSDQKVSTDGAGKRNTAGKTGEVAEAPSPQETKPVLPEVEIPDSVKGNVLLKIITKQAGMLLDQVDNTE